MKFIYSDEKKHSLIDLEKVISIFADDDGDLVFTTLNKEKYWVFADKEKAHIMKQNIADFIEANNMSKMIKL